MLPSTKLKTTILLASAILLYTSPLAAARSKSAATRVKAPSVAHTHITHSSHARATHSAEHTTSTASNHHSRPGKTQTAKVHESTSPRESRKLRESSKPQVVVAHAAVQPRYHGQQSIDQARTLEIQQALIREHYLDGDATGEWDQATRDALTRYQSDNHWQTKILPDSRALIKLGLGPSQQNLLNPDSAATAEPYQFEHAAPGGSN